MPYMFQRNAAEQTLGDGSHNLLAFMAFLAVCPFHLGAEKTSVPLCPWASTLQLSLTA